MAFYDEYLDHSAFAIGFAKTPHESFGVYARGYHHAAARLARFLLDRPRFPDYEAYPVVFLFRHSLELSMKNVIYSCARLARFRDVTGIELVWNNSHNLEALFSASERALSILFPRDESLRQFMSRVGTVCQDFSSLDTSSYAFRYPIDTKGSAPFPKAISMSLQSLLDRMTEVHGGFEAIDFGLDIETTLAKESREALTDVLTMG